MCKLTQAFAVRICDKYTFSHGLAQLFTSPDSAVVSACDSVLRGGCFFPWPGHSKLVKYFKLYKLFLRWRLKVLQDIFTLKSSIKEILNSQAINKYSKTKYEPPHDTTNKVACVSDQYGQLPSLIRVLLSA